MKALPNKYPLTLLAIAGGVLLWLGWPTKGLPIFLFIGFVPLLFIEHRISYVQNSSKPAYRLFRHAYLFFLIWNALTTYWVSNSTLAGGLAAIILNALLMSLPVMAFYFTKRLTGQWVGYFSFVIYYLAFESFHLSWDLTWPWLTLGNGFATTPWLVQWYAYTGHLGGSVWILLCNLFLFLALRQCTRYKMRWAVAGLVTLAVPALLSVYIWNTYKEQGEEVEVVVVQPNIDPYTEKFWSEESPNTFIPHELQLDRMLQLSAKEITAKTSIVLWPETALATNYDEARLNTYDLIGIIKRFVAQYPNLHVITGLDTYTMYGQNRPASPTARFRQDLGFYDVFNTALHINNAGSLAVYHKSKLVPGVEKLPYPQFFNFLGPLAIDLGGTVGSLGSQAERTVFKAGKIGVAPVICYESIYGDFVTGYVRKGASLIGIITNDAWWGNSPGYKQHLHYARLRAIENRRSIARSANTGISGFINQRGDILQQSVWWKKDALKQSLKANTTLTFYSKHGDYLGIGAYIFTTLLLLITILRAALSKMQRAGTEQVLV